MKLLIIPVSVPAQQLRPNGQRGNAYVARELRRKQRAEAATAAFYALAGAVAPRWRVAHYSLVLISGRQWDDDNLIASLKGGRDGLADAGIVADDRGLKITGVEWRAVGPAEMARVEFHVEGPVS